jgi:hypothetical protein
MLGEQLSSTQHTYLLNYYYFLRLAVDLFSVFSTAWTVGLITALINYISVVNQAVEIDYTIRHYI